MRSLTIEKFAKNVVDKQKANGAHFTPMGLADVVARRLMNNLNKQQNKKLRVLDPSCGEGELLLAFERVANLINFNKVKLIGVEQDKNSIEISENRLNQAEVKDYSFLYGDFLEMVNTDDNLSLFDKVKIEPVDVIIANPPYVRTQILGAEKAQQLAKKFNLKGRVDLYHAFLVAMTTQLKSGGLLGVITSNRYLTTKGGESVRRFLNENYDVIEIIDLGDTKLFGAAVLPAIFIGRKKENNDNKKNHVESARFFKIYEDITGSNSEVKQTTTMYKLLEVTKSGTYQTNGKHYSVSIGKLIVSENYKEPWVMATNEEYSWYEKINKNAFSLIEEICKVKVGIKTTADEVFIKKNWETVSPEIRPENELLKPLISAEHSAKWCAIERIPNQKVLYTHENRNGKRQAIDMNLYKRAKNYLETHRDRLERRKYVLKAKRKWYEIWVPHNPDFWKLPKVVFPDISSEPKFFYDSEGCIVDGNCYWIIPRNEVDNDILLLIMGVSNTKYMTKYHDIAFQNKLYAGRRRYLTQYVSKYPLPNPKSKYSLKIIELVRVLTFENPNVDKKNEIEQQIEILTAKAFGVAPI